MSAADAGYAPLSYHCGSVWPHDTAIVIGGLHRAGLGEYAAGLIEGLLRASVAFDQRRARAVERRRPSGAVSGGLPTTGLVGRIGGRGGTSRRGAVSDRPATVDLVAAINGRRLRVLRSDRGLVLPQISGDDGWSDPPEILEVAQDPEGMIMVPAVLIESEPRSMLHVVAVASGSSADGVDRPGRS